MAKSKQKNRKQSKEANRQSQEKGDDNDMLTWFEQDMNDKKEKKKEGGKG